MEGFGVGWKGDEMRGGVKERKRGREGGRERGRRERTFSRMRTTWWALRGRSPGSCLEEAKISLGRESERKMKQIKRKEKRKRTELANSYNAEEEEREASLARVETPPPLCCSE